MMASLRISRLSVPKAVENGSSLFLSCLFDLNGETLYSVKWYRDYVEFFRFLPSNAPTAAQTIRLKGAFVDVSKQTRKERSYTRSRPLNVSLNPPSMCVTFRVCTMHSIALQYSWTSLSKGCNAIKYDIK